VAGDLGLDFPHGLLELQSGGAATRLEEQSHCIVTVLGPDLPRLQGLQFCSAVAGGTKPAGLCFLLSMVHGSLWYLLTQREWFPWHFRVKVAGHVLGRVWSSEFLCLLGNQTYH
jgi:hypothetical protein